MSKRLAFTVFGVLSGFALVSVVAAAAFVLALGPGDSVDIAGVDCRDGRLRVVWATNPDGSRDRSRLRVECRAPRATATPSAIPTDILPTLIPEPTPTASPTPPGVLEPVAPLVLGECAADVHDRYAVVGPDGRLYRTWHPVVDASGCVFAHEHGDYLDAAPRPLFGYAARQAGMSENHVGYKCYGHSADNRNGWGDPEADYRGRAMNFTVCVHQGTGGAGRFTSSFPRFHEFQFWSDEMGLTQIYMMADVDIFQPVDHDSPIYEIWSFVVDVGGAWNNGAGGGLAVTNPLMHSHGADQPARFSCQGLFQPTDDSCSFIGPGMDFNGTMRTYHEPDFFWRNADGDAVFCTNPFGARQSCALPDSIAQRVAPATFVSDGAILLRTDDARPGFQRYVDPIWRVGAPGGN